MRLGASERRRYLPGMSSTIPHPSGRLAARVPARRAAPADRWPRRRGTLFVLGSCGAFWGLVLAAV